MSNTCVATALSGCCVADADCADQNPCTTTACGAGNLCVVTTAPGCCFADADCDNGDACSTDTCVAGACIHQPVTGCCTEVGKTSLLAITFLPGIIDGWQADPAQGQYRWREQAGTATDGNSALYFGDQAGEHFCPQFAVFGTPAGTATMPVASGAYPTGVIALPAGAKAQVSFDARLAIRTQSNVDRLWLEVIPSGGGAVEVWNKTAVPNAQFGSWASQTVDLSAWAGQSVTLRFRFDVVNNTSNGGCYDAGAGPRIDDVRVDVSTCGLGCKSDLDCNDGKTCTTDTCTAGVCSNVAATSTRFDFSFTDQVDGWSPTGGAGPVSWRESGGQTTSPPLALYFGNAASDFYCLQTTANADLPGEPNPNFPLGTVSFGASGATVLTFDVWLDIRTSPDVDKLEVVLVREDGTELSVWGKASVNPGAYRSWVSVTVDVTAVAPFTGKVRFKMDVGSTFSNGTCFGRAGVFVDDVRLIQICPAG